jgi:hypothetical protein
MNETEIIIAGESDCRNNVIRLETEKYHFHFKQILILIR